MKNLCTGSQEIAPHSIPGFDAIAPMALEPRFMFDAAGAATAADSAEQAQADAEAEQATQQESDTSSSNGDGSQSEDAATQQDVPASGSEFDVLRTVDAAQNGSRKEVVFIDGSLTDIDDLIADIGDGVEIVVLDGNADGLDQIVAWAAQNADFDALHIISHGAEGAVYLGDMTLNSETVVARADDLAAIGASLTESGDILLYGCRVAGGDGKAFADALASATGADIAASLDDTGASNLGGDWELEYAAGALEGAAYSSSYEHLLATDNMDSATASGATVTSSVDGVGYTIATSSGGSWFEFSGQTVTYTSGGSGTVPFIGGHFWGQATGDGTSYTFTFDSPVSITSIGMLSVSSESGATYVFSDTTSGSSNSNVNVAFDSLDGVTMTMGGGYHATNVSLGWSAVSSFTVTLTNGDGNMRLAFDNLVASAAPANNAPTLSGAPSSVTVTEDVSTNIDLSGITVADSDPDTLTVTLTATAGVMTASSSGGVTVGGSGTGTLTLSGSAANINTYLDTTTNVSYQGASNANGNSASTISAKVNDGTVDSSTSSISVSITAVNDVPTVSGAPSDVTVTEDQESNIDLSSVSFADVDGDTLTVTLNASAGTFSTPADGAGVGGGVTETLVSATQITLVGTAADINTYLSAPTSIKYTPAAGVSGQDQATITVSATDGNGGSLSSNPSINVDVTAVNDAPVLTGLDGTPSFTEGGSAVVFDSDVTVSDVELAALNGGNGNFAGATLVLVRNGGANAVDTFSINTGGSLTVAGSNISAGGSVIASFDTSSAGQLTVTFQDNGTTPTTALVNEVMQAIRYSNASNDPGSSVQIDWTFSDGNSGSAQGSGGALTATGSTAVSITNVNDAPTLAATGQDPTYVEGAGSADLFSGVTADTIEATNTTDRFAAMTMTVTNVSDGASEIIRFDGSDVALTNGNSVTTATNGLSISVSVTGSTATLSFTGASLTNAQMQTLVDSMGYRNTSDNPTTAGNRVVTITGVTDNGGTANSGANSVAPNLTSTVSLTGVNDAPVIGNIAGDNTGVQPGTAANIDKDGNFTISNADSADYNGGSLVITPNGGNSASGNFAVDGTNVTAGGDGTIAAGQTIAVGGVAIGTVDGTNNGQGGNTLTISLNANATDARVQTLVRNLQWSASAGSGAQSFDLTINDNDGTANSGAENASATFSVTLGNPPSIAGISGDSVNFTEGDSAVVLDASGDLTITDADSPASYDGGNLTVTVSGNAVAGEDILTLDTSGTVSLAATTAGSNVSVGGVVIGTLANSIAAGNDLVVNLNNNATVARIQTLARAVAYDNGSSENPTASTRSVSMTVTDNDGLASSTVVSSVVVSAVNDAPSATGVPTSITVTEDTAGNVDLSAITLTDVDAGSNNITVTITASAGTLAASSSGGVTIGGSSTGTLTLTGTVANIDTYLNTASNIQYTGAANATGNSAATLTITANDGGNSGSGGGTNVALGSVAVNITGVNDAPTMGSLSGDSVNYTAGQTIRVDSGQNALVTDIDSTHFNAGTLTVSITAGGIASEDILSLVTSGTNVTLSGTTAGSTVSVGGTQIGTLGNAIGAGTNLVINFDTQDATPARVQELVRAVSYRNNAGTPTVANRTVTFTLSDGSDSSSVTSTIVVSQPPATTTPPPPAPPPTAPPPVVNVPPILQAPGTSGGGDSGTPVSNAIVQNTSGGGSAGPIIAGGTIQTTVTGNLGNTSPIGNSGTPVSAGLSSSGVAGGLGGGNTIIGGGAANGGGFGSGQGVGLGGGLGGASSGGAGVGGVAGGFGGSGVGGASNAGGGVGGAPSGGIGSGAPGGADSGNAAGSGLGGGLGGQPGDGLNGENSDEQTPGQGQPSDDGTPAGESEGDDQAALDDTENHNVMAWNDDFAGQLAAFGELSEREARQLAAALEIHKVPA